MSEKMAPLTKRTSLFQQNEDILHVNIALTCAVEITLVATTAQDYCTDSSSRWCAVLLIAGLCFQAKNSFPLGNMVVFVSRYGLIYQYQNVISVSISKIIMMCMCGENFIVTIGPGNGMVLKAPCHYLIQCWPRHHRPQLVNFSASVSHSILDQQQKQSIQFQGGQCIGEFDGRLFVASGKQIYALVPVAMEKQVFSENSAQSNFSLCLCMLNYF